LVELRDCKPGILKDLDEVRDALVTAAKEAKATWSKPLHGSTFDRHGHIAESHLSIHTWPEYGYAAVDIFTCGDLIKPEVAANYLVERFECKSPSMVEMKRGILSFDHNVKLPHKIEEEEAAVYAATEELQMVP
jgi:S-adenosylmethionine decarboxylase